MENELNWFMVLAYNGLLSDDDLNFVIESYVCRERRMPRFRFSKHGFIDLKKMSDDDVVSNFRFEREDLDKVRKLLGIPDVLKTPQRYKTRGLTGFCILLRRLTYPNRLCDLEPLFGLSAPYLSVIGNYVTKVIKDNKGHVLGHLNQLKWLNDDKFEEYSEVIAAKGSPLKNCWAFIDGTARRICRPTVQQEKYFSGHKRMHCVKYQSVLAPDGLIVSLHGAYPGRRHDSGIFRDSEMRQQLSQVCNGQFVIYGDPAYPVTSSLICPFCGCSLSAQQQLFNSSMSYIIQAVEWGFQKIIAEFAFVDFSKNQKLLLQDICSMYKVAAILTNCHTCLYGSQVSQYFDIEPISLEQYLG